LFFSFTEKGTKVKDGNKFRLVAWDQDHREGDGSCTIESDIDISTIKSKFGYGAVTEQPTSTPAPNSSPTQTSIPTQKLNTIYIPFVSGGSGPTQTPTPIPTTAFTVTVNLTTQTLCSNETLAVLAQFGITKPAICL